MKYGIIVPTMGLPHLAVFTQSLIESWRGNGHVVFSFNVKDIEQAKTTREKIESMLQGSKVSYDILWSNEPLGFGGACNVGLTKLMHTVHDLDHVIFANDDLILTKAWVQGIQNAHRAKKLYTDSLHGMKKNPVSKDLLGGDIGLVGPCSMQVAGNQNIANDGNQQALKGMGIQQFAIQYMKELSGKYLRTDFLSGFCLSISKDCLNELATFDPSTQYIELFDECFSIGGFEDNDLCVRAVNAGFQLVIAMDTYVHHNAHSTFKTYFEKAQVGMHNRLKFYQKWAIETQKAKKVLIATYRLSLKCVNDLAQFGSSIKRAKRLGINGASILLTNDATEILSSYDSNLLSQLPSIEQEFARELASLIDTDDNSKERKKGVLKAFKTYLDCIMTGQEPFLLKVELSNWQTFDEREERNKTHEMAESLGADWCISIDADEILEDRLTIAHLQRLMSHPDPLVHLYHTGWINHWETMNLVRTDPPFTSGSDLRGGMNGPRMWRVKKSPQRIVSGTNNGLHCGNAPEYSPLSARISSVRFRHLSHVRQIDRIAKKQFYDKVDIDKDPIFIGGIHGNNNYAHIAQSDNVQVQLYNPANGLASFMLCYEDEDVEMIAQKLDLMYAISDELILVWTGEWNNKQDMENYAFPSWNEQRKSNFAEPSEWFTTGPSYKLWALAKFFGVKWLHHKFDNEIGLSACRNAAIEYVRENCLSKGISWMQFLDPDEIPMGSNHEHNLSVRRCIEQNDCWGMMYTFKNKLPQGSTIPFSTSQSVRLFRVDPKGIMRFQGRAHETLEHSFRALQSQGITPNVRSFPIQWINMGLSGDEFAMAKKLRKYTEMIVKDLNADPINPQAWLSLGLQYINEKDHEKAEICLERSCMVAGDAFMPFKELAVIQLNKALGMLLACKKRLNGSEKVFWRHIDDLIAVIQQSAPPHPIINTGENNIIADIELPAFPYDKIVVSDSGEFLFLDNEKYE